MNTKRKPSGSIYLFLSFLKSQEEDIIIGNISSYVNHFEIYVSGKTALKYHFFAFSHNKRQQGTIIGASKIARDISDRRASDESKLFGSTVETLDDAIISKTLEGNSWIKLLKKTFGYTADEGSETYIIVNPPPVAGRRYDYRKRIKKETKLT